MQSHTHSTNTTQDQPHTRSADLHLIQHNHDPRLCQQGIDGSEEAGSLALSRSADILARPRPGCVSLGKSLRLPGPQFPHLTREDNAAYPAPFPAFGYSVG